MEAKKWLGSVREIRSVRLGVTKGKNDSVELNGRGNAEEIQGSAAVIEPSRIEVGKKR